MKYKFNPLTGKLDMVGNGGDAASEVMDSGVMLEAHGGLEATDFSKVNMTVKDALKRILCKPAQAKVTPSGGGAFLVGTSHTVNVAVTVEKKSYDITSVVIGGQTPTPTTINGEDKYAITANNVSSDTDWNYEVTENVNGAEAKQNGKISAKFYYPNLIFTTDTLDFDTVLLYYNTNAKTFAIKGVKKNGSWINEANFSAPSYPDLGTTFKRLGISNTPTYPRIGILTKSSKYDLQSAAPTGTESGVWPKRTGIAIKLTFSNKALGEYADGDFIDYGSDWNFYYTTQDANTGEATVVFDVNFKNKQQ
ncbi:MAG: hypothetical protein J6U04_06285 [Salinivirgaceae bacterium]|nr:hypothetical protein [Salinivirgaceae bacterium]